MLGLPLSWPSARRLCGGGLLAMRTGPRWLLAVLVLVAGGPAQAELPPALAPYAVVDCLLPPQLIRVGEHAVRMLPSQPAKLSAQQCGQRGGSQTEGVNAWQALAGSGNVDAQTYLGEMYENGIGGVSKDLGKAKALYERAAAAGGARAASNLALLSAKKPSREVPTVPPDVERSMQQAANNVGLRELVVEPVIPTRPVTPNPGTRPADLQGFGFGKYHALLIGNSDYRLAPKLRSPVHEIEAIGQLLEQRFGFRVVKLRNATGSEILKQLDEMDRELQEGDNLLVYYTGHGAQSESREGYWIPVDGESPFSPNGNRVHGWVPSSVVRDKLSVMKPRHILVVADSCYSGRFLQFRGLPPSSPATPSAAYLDGFAKLYGARSRVALTSGGLTPVLEAGDSNNLGLFARAFVRALQGRSAPVASADIFVQLSPIVVDESSKAGFAQEPQWGPISAAGHESGDFWFRPR